MISANDVVRVYDTLLSVPGMHDNVKVETRMSRKRVLLLAKVIDRGLKAKPDEKEGGIMDVFTPEDAQVIGEFAKASLEKAGLTELQKKLDKLTR